MILWETIVLGIHILGACIWVGGTFALGVVVSVLARTASPGDPRVAAQTGAVARALTWVMWPALGVTILTGLVNLTWYLPAGDWVATPQGQWLLAKFFVVAVVLLTAGGHSFVIGPRIRRLRQGGATEDQLRGLRHLNGALAGVSAVASGLVIFLAVVVGSF
jgi:uncharacterized membrane protein